MIFRTRLQDPAPGNWPGIVAADGSVQGQCTPKKYLSIFPDSR